MKPAVMMAFATVISGRFKVYIKKMRDENQIPAQNVYSESKKRSETLSHKLLKISKQEEYHI